PGGCYSASWKAPPYRPCMRWTICGWRTWSIRRKWSWRGETFASRVIRKRSPRRTRCCASSFRRGSICSSRGLFDLIATVRLVSCRRRMKYGEDYTDRSDPMLRAFSVAAVWVLAAHAGPVEFNRDVRPILSDRCYSCNGPDKAARKSPLRLDQETSAKSDLGKGRFAIVPREPDHSEMVRRITAPNPAMRM